MKQQRRDARVLETAHRLLCAHYRIVADNLPGAVAARSPIPLHDIRVAIRRLCAVLRAFRKPLERTRAVRLAEPFSQLNSELGPIRDADVWLAYLHGRKPQRQLEHDKAWPAYIAACESIRRRHVTKLRRLLRSRRVALLMKRAGDACHVELSGIIRTRRPAPVRPFAAAQLRPLFEDVVGHKDVAPATSPEDLHDLRKRCRRGRYYAEFFAPALGPLSENLARHFKGIADPLGRIHDVDVALERIEKSRVKPPRGLRKILLRRRAAAWKTFRKGWKAIRRRKFVKRVEREL